MCCGTSDQEHLVSEPGSDQQRQGLLFISYLHLALWFSNRICILDLLACLPSFVLPEVPLNASVILGILC